LEEHLEDPIGFVILVLGSISDMESEKDMLCPSCKRGVISYYRYCPWCGTDVHKTIADFTIEKGQNVTLLVGDIRICEINGKSDHWKLLLMEGEAQETISRWDLHTDRSAPTLQMTREQGVQILKSQMELLQGQLDQILKRLRELEEKK